MYNISIIRLYGVSITLTKSKNSVDACQSLVRGQLMEYAPVPRTTIYLFFWKYFAKDLNRL
ncbi:MAG: hypothetical protein A2086_12205 [Spirochaetes bacterium GWD1_27_9]|nr:MAG: hypothetical protein A2Z98_06695 [Spirochaetes bacterium GWB1_27_13]OHD26201.1 MAG: hypothetical protein A2Y34_09625 [Spirochaetes bacterium GWC1_27_15]OHD35743.1 MAG: hypothetical protein A2086_12205 [Spirochaetes bacterium GWD1_27_9]